MEAILLAAGTGSRLKEKTTHLPKSLLELADKTIIEHTIETFINIKEISRIVIVTGFERDRLMAVVDKYASQIEITEVFNPDFKRGNLYSVEKGLTQAKAPFFITNADHIFPQPLLEKCIKNAKGVSAICDFDRDLEHDCMKVAFRTEADDKKVVQISKKLEEFNCGYIGMTFVSLDQFKNYMSAFDKIADQNIENAYAEQVLQTLAGSKETAPFVFDASGFGWIEVDTAEDLKSAQQVFTQYPNFINHGKKSL